MKWIKRIAIVVGIVYLLLCSALFFIQEQIIFLPHQLSEQHTFRAGEEFEIEVEDGIALNGLWLKTPSAKGVILYLHGNKGNLRRCLYQAQSSMTGHGYDVCMIDYRGYGKSDGEIFSEEQLLGDVDKVYQYVKRFYPENKIILLGYSLGTGMASYLAEKYQPQQLVLLAPYSSLCSIKDQYLFFTPDILLKYHLNSAARIQNIDCPITIFHGTADRIIPYENSKHLASLSAKINLITMQGESHRGVLFNDVLRKNLAKLIQ